VTGAAVKTSCHCGAVRIEIARRPRSITECNCSICRRYGARWAYFRSTSVQVVAGVRALRRYARGRMLFFEHCSRCGCVMRWRLQKGRGANDRLGVNMRMAEDPSLLANATIRRFDGAVSWKDVGVLKLRHPSW
jgi:hypothetical protein